MALDIDASAASQRPYDMPLDDYRYSHLDWNRAQLAHLFAPLPETLRLNALDYAPQQGPPFTLVHVLSTCHIELREMPHLPDASITMPVLKTMTLQKLKKRTAAALFLPTTIASRVVQYTWSISPETEYITLVQHLQLSSDCKLRPPVHLLNGLSRQIDVLNQHNLSRPVSAASHASRPMTANGSVIDGAYPVVRSRPQSAIALPAVITNPIIKSQHAIVRRFAEEQPRMQPWHRRDLSAGKISFATTSDMSSTLKKRSSEPMPSNSDNAQCTDTSLHRQSMGSAVHGDRLQATNQQGQGESARDGRERGRSPTMHSVHISPGLLPNDRSGAPKPASPASEIRLPSRQSRSRSPIRIDMSQCPPKLEWQRERSKSPLKRQSTGNAWLTGWLARPETFDKESPQFHLNRLKSKNRKLRDIHRDLIDLRVQFGVAPESWIVDLVADDGLNCFATLLGRARLEDCEATGLVCKEIVKCIRILLETAPGHDAVVRATELICALCGLARDPRSKCQSLTNDLLTSLCMSNADLGISVIERELGQPGPRAARFNWLMEVRGDRHHDIIRSRLQLINALTGIWPTAEERIAFRRTISKDKILGFAQAARGDANIETQVDLWLRLAEEDAKSIRQTLADEALPPVHYQPNSTKMRLEMQKSPVTSDTEEAETSELTSLEKALPDTPFEDNDELCLLKGQVSEMRGLVQTLRQELAMQKERNLQKLTLPAPDTSQPATLTTAEVRDILRPILRHQQRPKSMSNLDDIKRPLTATPTSPRIRSGLQLSPLRQALLQPRGKKEGDILVNNGLISVRPLQVRPSGRVLSNVSERSQEAESREATVPDAVGDSAQSEPQKEATQMIADAIETGPEDPGLGTGIEVTEAPPDPVSSPESQEQHNDIVAALAPPPPPPPSPSLLLLKRSAASGLTGNRNRAESPTKSLKPLFWDKLGPSNVGHGTIWSDLVDAQPSEEVQKGIACDIQRLFAKHPKSGLSMRASTLSRANSVRQTVALIDLTKAKNMEIVLARVRLQPDELRDAILQMDETKLRNSDIVRTLIDIAPSPEDLATVSAYKGDVVRLGLAEKHILALGSIAHLKERLSAMAFQQRFDLEIAELLPDLATSRRACSEVYQSQLLKQTLALVLYAGNILYESTLRGDAHGFQLASLLKLAEMKSTLTGKSETTLLQYLVATHEKVVGHRVDFTAELPHCTAASKISSTLFRNNVAQLENGLRHAKEQVDCVSSSQVAKTDVFAAKMKPFLEHASQIVERVASNAAALQGQQRALLLYLGEEPSTPIEQVFATLATVMRLLQSASDANVQQTE